MTADRFAGTLFARLRDACAPEWRAYADHPFVQGLATGALPEPAFRHYLVQDYLFLIQFARAYGLAAYKAETLADIRYAGDALHAIVAVEMDLHVAFCRAWRLSESDLGAAQADRATLAYTRYVLERGTTGDLLDLHVALAPCVVGYAEIGARLGTGGADRLESNPYRAWIEMYAGADYQGVAREAVRSLDRIGAGRGAEARLPSLIETFRTATVLETDFWQMGLDAARPSG